MMKREARLAQCPTGRVRRLTAMLALLSNGLAAAAGDVPQAAATPASHVERPRAAHAAASALDARVRLMAKELALDPQQQIQLGRILQTQREEIARAWRDPSVPAAIRVAATQAIGEKTSDRIRAILDDPQREKYMKSHQHDAPVGAAGGDVQTWIKAAHGLERPSATAQPNAAKEN